ncbi:MAG: DUF3888 domain-containing protein [Bacillota bacterium]
MGKYRVLLLLLLLVFAVNTNNINAKQKIDERDTDESLLLEEAFLRAMSPEILSAISKYYKEPKLYFLERINDVKKNKKEDTFDVTVQVVTYEKAILPPYGLETITLRIPGYEVINFKHKDIKGEELPKDKFD